MYSMTSGDLDSMTDTAAIMRLEREFHGWLIYRGTERLCHARHHDNDTHLRGEDWLDLRDELRRYLGSP